MQYLAHVLLPKIKMTNKIIILNNGDNLILNEANTSYEIVVSNDSNVTIEEYNISNSVVKLTANADSNVKYNIVNNKIVDVKRDIIVGKNASLDIVAVNIGGANDNSVINIDGEGANVKFDNLNIADGNNQIINTRINHNAMHSTSRINNIGVAIKDAEISYDTAGFVKNGVPGCDCRQLSKGVIVGDNAKVTTKPILLIDYYDVMAYHGASIGKMSDEELFYLMSRGLSKTEAFMLILNGLIDPILSKLINNEIREKAFNDVKLLLKED